MRILILSYYYPPHAGMGALRVGRLAAFLSQAGHEVRVVAARASANDPIDSSMAVVSYTKWLDINFAPNQASRFKNWIFDRYNPSAPVSAEEISHARERSEGRPTPISNEVLPSLDRLYRLCLNIPDDKIGWLPFALWQGWRTARAFKPDVIYASGPPPTGLAAAAWLARHLSVPWVAEIRDRWGDDPYDPKPSWRVSLDRKLERRVLSSARAIVTVSETWARTYRERYGKPTAVIHNGFTPGDYEQHSYEPPSGARDSLRIVYTGAVYAGRDPTTLWQALRLLGPAADGIRVEFYGGPDATILAGAARHGVSENLRVRETLPHGETARLQCQADVLLLLQWNNPSEAGNIPGKLFEYLGARRPILVLGFEAGEMARIVHERQAGLLANDPEAIVRQLIAWYDEKRKTGCVAPPPETARTGFTWDEQVRELNEFLMRIAR